MPSKKAQKRGPGPEPELLKIKGSWEKAIGRVIRKNNPPPRLTPKK